MDVPAARGTFAQSGANDGSKFVQLINAASISGSVRRRAAGELTAQPPLIPSVRHAKCGAAE